MAFIKLYSTKSLKLLETVLPRNSLNLIRGLATFNNGIEVKGEVSPGFERVLTNDALTFIGELHRKFECNRQELLVARTQRQKKIDHGENLKFSVGDHDDKWQVATVPDDLQCRHVEITGPVERKMMINALNSGADVFMADFEDSCSPTWSNIINGHINLIDANNRVIEFTNSDGTIRSLEEKTAQLLVRTRGWHLDEKHVLVDGKPVSGSLIDFGLYFFHNINIRRMKNSSTYYYLPKMEHHTECRLWNEVFKFSENYLSIPQGTIRATVMVETFPAAFEIEEMLYELRDYACGMNAGRWDYIFSVIKTLKTRDDAVLPDRKQITMQVPFMKSYAEHLVKICHKHGAHAMGGMSAFIPSRRDEEVNKVAIEQVTKDKEREVAEGYDGTWVAHPDLVKLAKDIFMRGLDGKANQKEKQFKDMVITENDLSTIYVHDGKVTENGVRTNVAIALEYLTSWFQGQGAAALYNLMEDAATAEISRAQLWQWLHHKTKLDDGRTFTVDLFQRMLAEEVKRLGGRDNEAMKQAADIVEKIVLSEEFETFLTIPGYECLVGLFTK